MRTWCYLKKTKTQTTQSKHTQAPSFSIQCPTLITLPACTRAEFLDTKGPAAWWQHANSWRPVLQGAVTVSFWEITHQHAADSLCLLCWRGLRLVFEVWSQLFQGYMAVIWFLCLLCCGFYFFPWHVPRESYAVPSFFSKQFCLVSDSYGVAVEDKNVFRKRLLSDGISSILKAWNSIKKMKSLSW